MGKLTFCQHFLRLRGKPISFVERAYLHAPYHSEARRLVIRASRQVEKSTFLVNTMVHLAMFRPRSHILFVCPRKEQAQVFSKSRLLPVIQESPLISRVLLGKRGRAPQVMNMHFANGSKVYVRAAYHSADAARGIDADLLVIDEFQDIANGALPVLEEALSHSDYRRVILTGTPKTIDNHLESVFRQSTACEYLVTCMGCQQRILLDEKCLGPLQPSCPHCGQPIDPRQGAWLARNPMSTWGDGYWINHLMVPWVNYAELLERQRTYDPALFKNECLGLSTQLGDHIVTRAELESCCREQPLARTLEQVPARYRDYLVAGIDWGGGASSRTVVVVGYMDDKYRFVLVRLDRLARGEDPNATLERVAAICRQFRPRWIGADGGGNGHVYNRMLVDRLQGEVRLTAILYSAADQAPFQDGVLIRWTINRSASIGVVFGRIKKQTLLFPRVADSGSFLEEFACEIAEYDDQLRSIKYTHPESQPDDALHATNYALHIGAQEYARRRMFTG